MFVGDELLDRRKGSEHTEQLERSANNSHLSMHCRWNEWRQPCKRPTSSSITSRQIWQSFSSRHPAITVHRLGCNERWVGNSTISGVQRINSTKWAKNSIASLCWNTPTVVVVDGNFIIQIYCTLTLSVGALRHGNAFSHFCLHLLLVVLYSKFTTFVMIWGSRSRYSIRYFNLDLNGSTKILLTYKSTVHIIDWLIWDQVENGSVSAVRT